MVQRLISTFSPLYRWCQHQNGSSLPHQDGWPERNRDKRVAGATPFIWLVQADIRQQPANRKALDIFIISFHIDNNSQYYHKRLMLRGFFPLFMRSEGVTGKRQRERPPASIRRRPAGYTDLSTLVFAPEVRMRTLSPLLKVSRPSSGCSTWISWPDCVLIVSSICRAAWRCVCR